MTTPHVIAAGMDVLLEAQTPSVGLFWLIPDKFTSGESDMTVAGKKYKLYTAIASVSSTDDKHQIGGWLNPPFDHINLWEFVTAKYPQLKDKNPKTKYPYDYDEIPRGRVVYNQMVKQAAIITSTDLAAGLSDQANLSRFGGAFGLPPARITIKADEHY